MIKYIGSKRLLVEHIAAVIERALAYAARAQRVQALLAELEGVAPQTKTLIEDLRRQCSMVRAQGVRRAG